MGKLPEVTEKVKCRHFRYKYRSVDNVSEIILFAEQKKWPQWPEVTTSGKGLQIWCKTFFFKGRWILIFFSRNRALRKNEVPATPGFRTKVVWYNIAIYILMHYGMVYGYYLFFTSQMKLITFVWGKHFFQIFIILTFTECELYKTDG